MCYLVMYCVINLPVLVFANTVSFTFIVICVLREISFSDFLLFIIERQTDSRDIYEEIRHGFKMFDIGKL